MRRFKSLIWYISKCYTHLNSISSWLKCSIAVHSSEVIQKHSFKQSKCHLLCKWLPNPHYMRLNYTFTKWPYLHYKQEQQWLFMVKLLIHGDQSWIFFMEQFQLYFNFIVSHISIGFPLNVSPPSLSYRWLQNWEPMREVIALLQLIAEISYSFSQLLSCYAKLPFGKINFS